MDKSGLASLDGNYKQLYEHPDWIAPPALRDTSPRKNALAQNKRPDLPLNGPGGNHPDFVDQVMLPDVRADQFALLNLAMENQSKVDMSQEGTS
jgi:hypothetical protein